MTNDAGGIMAGLGSGLAPEDKADETVAKGAKHPPRKAPTKKVVTEEDRKRLRKQARKSRKRNRK